MIFLKVLLIKEVKRSMSLRGSYILSLAFFSITLILLPIGIGPDKNILSNISPGLIWVSIVLTSLLSLNSYSMKTSMTELWIFIEWAHFLLLKLPLSKVYPIGLLIFYHL